MANSNSEHFAGTDFLEIVIDYWSAFTFLLDIICDKICMSLNISEMLYIIIRWYVALGSVYNTLSP